MLPLEGITVVSLEQAIAAPLATRHLADMGARVIKIERPGTGDFARGYDTRARGMSSHFVWTNRGKQSLALDLKQDTAPPVLQALLARADVLVQNLAPGAMARLGMGVEDLRHRYPALIQCNISGYGPGGPYSDKKAYDLLIQAEAGFLSVTGTPEASVKAGISIADIAAGMYAYSSVLAALIQRGRTGKGSVIEVSMLEALTEWMGFPLMYAMDGAAPPARAGAAHATIYPYGPFAAGDGTVIVLGLQNEREWQAFCNDVLDDPPLASDPRFSSNPLRVENASALRTLMEACFAKLSGAELVARLEKGGIANARLRDMSEVWSHPQLQARGRFGSVEGPKGPMPTLMPPAMPDDQMRAGGSVPELGADTQAQLQELGFPPDFLSTHTPD